MNEGRGIALVTGATGGIGAACASRLARSHRLFLSDTDAGRLAQLTAELVAAGAQVACCHAADLGGDGEPARLVAAARAAGPLTAVVHTAGLSPAQADAAAILRLNVGGTEALLDALGAAPTSGLVVVLIASIGGHFARPDTAIDALCAQPADHDFPTRALALLASPDHTHDVATAASAYSYAKRANILSVQRRCAGWAAAGARLVSLSPGLVDTAMGRAEVATDIGAARMLELTPLGWVGPAQVADTAAFLLSEAAGAITGSDIKVDGGVLGAFFQGRSTTGACVA